jgi:hypothetical protein
MTLENIQEMRSFSVFLKVAGNECYITDNKVYIKSYKSFLRNVVSVCCRVERFKPLLGILINEGIIKAYASQLGKIYLSINLNEYR